MRGERAGDRVLVQLGVGDLRSALGAGVDRLGIHAPIGHREVGRLERLLAGRGQRRLVRHAELRRQRLRLAAFGERVAEKIVDRRQHAGNHVCIFQDGILRRNVQQQQSALAVNEENAAGGRVVTAPTNGAAGIIPAVLHYYQRFVRGASDDGIVTFLLTAGAIGSILKQTGSISGAEVGCQGEVGSASAMAAAGLTEITDRLRYEFAAHVLEKLIGPVFSHIGHTFIDAFVRRAETVYPA